MYQQQYNMRHPFSMFFLCWTIICSSNFDRVHNHYSLAWAVVVWTVFKQHASWELSKREIWYLPEKKSREERISWAGCWTMDIRLARCKRDFQMTKCAERNSPKLRCVLSCHPRDEILRVSPASDEPAKKASYLCSHLYVLRDRARAVWASIHAAVQGMTGFNRAQVHKRTHKWKRRWDQVF